MSRRAGSLALLVMAVAGLAASVTACGTITNRPRDVQARIEAFLVDVREQRGGSGWSHLQGHVQASYPGGQAAWIQAIASSDTSGLTWTIGEVTVDDYVGCARVDFGADRADVPLTSTTIGCPRRPAWQRPSAAGRS